MTALLLISVLQAVILGLVLFNRKTPPNRILGIWLFVTAADITGALLYIDERYKLYPHLIGIRYGIYYLHGPFLYLYVISLTSGRLAHRQGFMFLPFLLLKLYQIPFFILPAGEKLIFLSRFFSGQKIDYLIIDFLLIGGGFLFSLLSLYRLRTHVASVRQNYSFTEGLDFHWLRIAVSAQIIIWLVVIALSLYSRLVEKILLSEYVYVLVTLWVFLIGYAGFLRPELFQENSVEETDPGKKSAQKQSYSQNEIQQLSGYMETEPWKDGTLSLTDVSRETGLPAHKISRIINQEFKASFFKYVNRFRIEEAIRMLQDPGHNTFTILDIAYSVGFNSKSTFNAVFREITGKTPGDYRQKTANQK